MPVSYPLDHVIDRLLREMPSEEQLRIFTLTGEKVFDFEARAEWARIVEHKWYLGEKLGRDVGFKVAAIDYVDNIRGARRSRASRPAWAWLSHWLRPPRAARG
jgi:hypothetical protein